MWFLVPYVLFLCFLSFVVLAYPKYEGFLLLHPSSPSALDDYFKYITHIGDGISVALIALIILIFNRKAGYVIGLSFLISGGITQILKRTLEIPRPSSVVFDSINKIDGVILAQHLSFPSGHATSAFALFFSLKLLIKNKKIGLICFLLAALSAYSRVYLGQHFPADILVGSIIGVAISLVVFHIISEKK